MIVANEKKYKKVKKKIGIKKKGCNFVAVIKQQTHRKGKRNNIKLQSNMFKARKIQRRANELYSQMMRENSIITITGESYYDSAYRINFYVNGRCYQARITDDSLPFRPGTTVQTNSIEIASFAACVIAAKEYARHPEKYINTYNKCELI